MGVNCTKQVAFDKMEPEYKTNGTNKTTDPIKFNGTYIPPKINKTMN
jgi:hypothetical protein